SSEGNAQTQTAAGRTVGRLTASPHAAVDEDAEQTVPAGADSAAGPGTADHGEPRTDAAHRREVDADPEDPAPAATEPERVAPADRPEEPVSGNEPDPAPA